MSTLTYSRNAAAYRQTAVTTTSKERLVPLLYEHLLINLKRADRQIRAKDLEGKAESLGRASEIVYELLSALDFDQGGEIATRLASLYAYFLQELRAVSRKLDVARLGQMTEMIEELHETWQEAARIVEGHAGPAE